MVPFAQMGKIGRGRRTESSYFCLAAAKFEVPVRLRWRCQAGSLIAVAGTSGVVRQEVKLWKPSAWRWGGLVVFQSSKLDEMS